MKTCRHRFQQWQEIGIYLFVFILFASGCASQRDRQKIKALKEQVGRISIDLEETKKENDNLKKELTLFKKSQDIDSQAFIEAEPIFEAVLAEEIKAGDVWVQITDRGLVIVVLAEKLFVSGSDVLSDAGKAFLDKVNDLIVKDFPSNYLYIEGHTDNQSLAVFEWKSDWDFSFVRALSVLKYLCEKKQIDPLRLSASGFGQYRPKASNDTKEGRRLNRRIEIIISP